MDWHLEVLSVAGLGAGTAEAAEDCSCTYPDDATECNWDLGPDTQQYSYFAVSRS